MMDYNVYHKSRSFAPQGFFECEARGLQWLGQAYSQGGPRVAKVIDWGDDYLNIERIATTSPTPMAAFEFGASLAHLHDCGAAYFGQAPDAYTGTCYFGPLSDPVPMDTGQWDNPTDYLAQGRLLPMVHLGIRRGELSQDDLNLTKKVIDALPDLMGKAQNDKPARVHGDLWSGNVLWTKQDGQTQGVLIDPAAHGGHREEDLAMLHLFGISYFQQILDGYQSVHPLKADFADRFTLWQLYPIAGHCVFFGGGYVSEYRDMCEQLLERIS